MKFKEEELREFAKPLSESEEEQCKHAIDMVSSALRELGLRETGEISKKFENTPSYEVKMSGYDGYEVKIFLQGSYANNTNVKKNSDIDIAVVEEDRFYSDYRFGTNADDYGNCKAKPRERTFKDEVLLLLKKKFGDDVTRKNKSIKISGNSYRKDVDTVPSYRYRDYSKDFSFDENNYIPGICIFTDDGNRIINYPEQHLENGVKKNNNTKSYFKKMVRVAKEMRYLMKGMGYDSAKNISSYLVECLIWNVPDYKFTNYSSYRFIFEDVVNYLYYNRNLIASFKEVDDIKYIGDDDIKRIDACKKFVENLFEFYEYEF